MRAAIASISIDASRDEVFALISDLSMRPAFCDHFQEEYRLARMDSTGVGAAARFEVAAPRHTTWHEVEIVATDPPHRLSELGRCGRLGRTPTRTEWEVIEGPAGQRSAEVEVVQWTEPTARFEKVRESLSSPGWHRRQWERALRRLKELAESGEGEAPIAVGGGSRIFVPPVR